ncbi:MAG TPA: glycosyltransferase family 39 protein [Planctomycetota bacterium]|jgi:4-amino-4-deoxy-L-arabinose transferase-like glycosyltransferase|nr:glycosyltransferase family 39 protein [Planctomycetota bacterium]
MDPATTRSTRVLCAVLLALAVVLLAWILQGSMQAAVRAPNADDGYYLRYMQRVRESGLSAFPSLFDEWNATPKDWIYPPPSRVGFIVVSALWARLFGATIHALQLLSLASHLLLCVVNYVFARRHLGDVKALFVAVLIGFSTLLMGLSRLPLTDSFIALCMMTTVWLFLDLVQRPVRLARSIPFMASLALMVLVKELSVLLVVPLLLFVLYEKLVRRTPHDLARIALAFAIPGVVAIAVLLLAAGGGSPLVRTMTIVMHSPATNRYSIAVGSGPWFRMILDFLLLSPVPTLLALGGFAVAAARFRAGSYDRTTFLLGVIAVVLIFLFSFFTKNVRYGVVLELPIRVFGLLMIGALAGEGKSLRATLGAGLAVALVAFLEWRSFELFWVRYHGYDPVTHFLAIARELVPRGG